MPGMSRDRATTSTAFASIAAASAADMGWADMGWSVTFAPVQGAVTLAEGASGGTGDSASVGVVGATEGFAGAAVAGAVEGANDGAVDEEGRRSRPPSRRRP